MRCPSVRYRPSRGYVMPETPPSPATHVLSVPWLVDRFCSGTKQILYRCYELVNNFIYNADVVLDGKTSFFSFVGSLVLTCWTLSLKSSVLLGSSFMRIVFTPSGYMKQTWILIKARDCTHVPVPPTESIATRWNMSLGHFCLWWSVRLARMWTNNLQLPPPMPRYCTVAVATWVCKKAAYFSHSAITHSYIIIKAYLRAVKNVYESYTYRKYLSYDRISVIRWRDLTDS